MHIATISAQELQARHAAGQPIQLIDVRSPREFADGHVPFARNVPLDIFEPAAIAAAGPAPSPGPVYFICHLGMRSAFACEQCLTAGLSDVVNVDGGTDAWIAAGLPLAT